MAVEMLEMAEITAPVAGKALQRSEMDCKNAIKAGNYSPGSLEISNCGMAGL
ncbi:MAG: hypothetical protein J6X94_12960 [Lachnospiraceae bacterium]|nr:hypothetical protein [Lachnospiraceae bacterium]